MEYLKHLSKTDLISILEITYEARKDESLEQFQCCLQRLKDLILFDCFDCAYAYNEAKDKRKTSNVIHHAHDFPDDFITNYTQGGYYMTSPVFHRAFQTWEPQHWLSVWSAATDDFDPTSLRFVNDYGFFDGWTHANSHLDDRALSVFVFAGKKAEYDPRTAAILKYTIPHLAELLKSTISSTLTKQKKKALIRPTPRELEILEWLEHGKSSWDISVILNRSERVVNWHIENIKRKLCAINRTQAVAIALRKGLLD